MDTILPEEVKHVHMNYKYLVNNEAKWFRRIETKIRGMGLELDEKVNNNIRDRVKASGLTMETENGIHEFSTALYLMQYKLESIFLKVKIPVNAFFNNDDNKQILESEKIIFGIGSVGCIFAVRNILKMANPDQFKLILIGGEFILTEFMGDGVSEKFLELESLGIDFVCYIKPKRGDKKIDNHHFKYLDCQYFDPFPLNNYAEDSDTLLFFNCIGNGFLEKELNMNL